MNSPIANPVWFSLGPVTVTQVVVVTWAVMAGLIAAAAILRSRLRPEDPGLAQQITESLCHWLSQEIERITSRDARPFFPLIASLFLFILTSNLLSFAITFMPPIKPPTADINTTAALALIVFFAVPAYGISINGPTQYLRTYIKPVWVMLPFNLLSEVSRTLALAVRLFGNMLSGELLIGVVLSLVPFLLPLPLMFLNLITGTIQAYIFTILAIVYISSGIRHVEEKEEKDSAE